MAELLVKLVIDMPPTSEKEWHLFYPLRQSKVFYVRKL